MSGLELFDAVNIETTQLLPPSFSVDMMTP